MEADTGSTIEEKGPVYIAVMSKINPEDAKSELKKYLEDKKCTKAIYNLLPLAFLKENSLIDDKTMKVLARTSTRELFVQKRVFFIESSPRDFGLVYSALLHYSLRQENDSKKVVRYVLSKVDPLKGIDILSELVLLPSRLVLPYEKMVELFYAFSSSRHELSSVFLKNVAMLRNEFLNNFVLKKTDYGPKAFSIFLEMDYAFCEKNLSNFCRKKDTMRLFLRKVPSVHFSEYEHYFDNQSILENLEKISLKDALRYCVLYKDKRIFNQYWAVLCSKSYNIRFAYYEKLDEDQDTLDETKRLLKRLSLINVQTIYNKMEGAIYRSPISYFQAIIDTIYKGNTLLEAISKILAQIPFIFVDILYFCILKILVSQYSLVKDLAHPDWYLNLCSLFKEISPLVQLDATYDMLTVFLDSKRFLHIPVLECALEKYMETRKEQKVSPEKTRQDMKVPNSLVSHVKKAVNNVFLYEDSPLRLKVDLSERYRKVSELIDLCPFPEIRMSFENMRYLTPYEIKLEAGRISEEEVNEIVSSYKKDSLEILSNMEELGEKGLCDMTFFGIRNFILLVNIRKRCVRDMGWVLKYLNTLKSINREDLRILSESCMANIVVDERKSGRSSVDRDYPQKKLAKTIVKSRSEVESIRVSSGTGDTQASPKSQLEEGEIYQE